LKDKQYESLISAICDADFNRSNFKLREFYTVNDMLEMMRKEDE